MFVTSSTGIKPNFILILSMILNKKTKVQFQMCNNVYDDITYSSKTQKSNYLENKLLSLQIKKVKYLYIKGYNMT